MELFLKSLNALIEINNNSITEVMKKTGITYSYTSRVLKEFETKKLLTMKSKGRKKIISLTEKGEEIKNHLLAIRTILKS